MPGFARAGAAVAAEERGAAARAAAVHSQALRVGDDTTLVFCACGETGSAVKSERCRAGSGVLLCCVFDRVLSPVQSHSSSGSLPNDLVRAQQQNVSCATKRAGTVSTAVVSLHAYFCRSCAIVLQHDRVSCQPRGNCLYPLPHTSTPADSEHDTSFFHMTFLRDVFARVRVVHVRGRALHVRKRPSSAATMHACTPRLNK